MEKTFMKIKDPVDDPNHPFFYHVYTHTLPMEIQYRVKPKSKYFISFSHLFYLYLLQTL